MFARILAIENTKILRRWMLWIEMGIMAGLVVFIFGLMYVLGKTRQEAELIDMAKGMIAWPGSLMTAMNMAGGKQLGGLLLLVLVGAMTAQEYTWRTMHLWLSRGVSRAAVLGAKFVAIFLPAALIVLAPVVIGGLVSIPISLDLNGSLKLNEINGLQFLLSLGRVVYTMMPYAALAFMLAIITRSTAVAIGGSLAYALIIENVISLVGMLLKGVGFDKVAALVPGSMASVILGLNDNAVRTVIRTGDSGSIDIGQFSLSPTWAAVGLAVWTLLFLGLAWWRFSRQDITE